MRNTQAKKMLTEEVCFLLTRMVEDIPERESEIRFQEMNEKMQMFENEIEVKTSSDLKQ